VKEWMRIYRKEGQAGLKKPRRGRPKTLLKALAIELGEELPEGLDTGPSTDIEGNSA
jgi:transposase